MKYLNREIENELKNRGARLIRFVSISHLDEKQNRQLPSAIVFALPLTAGYIKEVCETPDYVQNRIADNYNFDDDEYLITENRTHELADSIAKYITERGYKAFSQSDESLLVEGEFDAEHKKSLLPHKTVALLGRLGWIGKNNLLITPEHGAAQCLGTVLTDAPLETVLFEPLCSKCGSCIACVDICEKHVLKNKTWTSTTSRDEIVDVHGCSTCLKCLVHCLRTQVYMKNSSN